MGKCNSYVALGVYIFDELGNYSYERMSSSEVSKLQIVKSTIELELTPRYSQSRALKKNTACL